MLDAWTRPPLADALGATLRQPSCPTASLYPKRLTAQSASLRHRMTQLRARLRPRQPVGVTRARRQGYQMRDANRRAARTGSA